MAVNAVVGLIGFAPGVDGARIAWEAHAFGFLFGILADRPAWRACSPVPTKGLIRRPVWVILRAEAAYGPSGRRPFPTTIGKEPPVLVAEILKSKGDAVFSDRARHHPRRSLRRAGQPACRRPDRLRRRPGRGGLLRAGRGEGRGRRRSRRPDPAGVRLHDQRGGVRRTGRDGRDPDGADDGPPDPSPAGAARTAGSPASSPSATW